jgi:hypothetical protein
VRNELIQRGIEPSRLVARTAEPEDQVFGATVRFAIVRSIAGGVLALPRLPQSEIESVRPRGVSLEVKDLVTARPGETVRVTVARLQPGVVDADPPQREAGEITAAYVDRVDANEVVTQELHYRARDTPMLVQRFKSPVTHITDPPAGTIDLGDRYWIPVPVGGVAFSTRRLEHVLASLLDSPIADIERYVAASKLPSDVATVFGDVLAARRSIDAMRVVADRIKARAALRAKLATLNYTLR